MKAIKKEYVSLEMLNEMGVGQAVNVELPSFAKIQAAKVAANTLKNREAGEWSIRLITNKVVEITRKS